MTPGRSRSSGKSRYRYLTLRCNKKDCPSRLDKKIKKGLRSKIIFEYISDFLKKGIEIDKKGYEEYKAKAQQSLITTKAGNFSLLQGYTKQIQGLEKKKVQQTNALGNADREALIKDLNKQIEETDNSIKSLEGEKSRIKEVNISIDHNLTTEPMSYDNFMNFFKYIGTTLRNSDNAYLVDKIVRLLFMNFVIKNQIVVSHQLNPNFEPFVKMPSVLPSRPS